MDLDKLSSGEKVAGVSSIVLFIFMFFDWFSAEVTAGARSASEGVTAWDALDWIPIVLVVTIVAALAVAALRLTDSRYEPPVSGNAIVSILGGLSFLLILYRIIDPPGASGSVPGFSFDVSPEFWIFVSLIAAAGIAYGGYKAMQDEGASFGELGERFSGGGSGGSGGSGGHGSAGGGSHGSNAGGDEPIARARHPGPAAASATAAASGAAERPDAAAASVFRRPDAAPASSAHSELSSRAGDPPRNLLREGDHGHHRVDPDRGRKQRRVGDVERVGPVH